MFLRIAMLAALAWTSSCSQRTTVRRIYTTYPISNERLWYGTPYLLHLTPQSYLKLVNPFYESSQRMDGISYYPFFRSLTETEKLPESAHDTAPIVTAKNNAEKLELGSTTGEVDIKSSIDNEPRILIKTTSSFLSLFPFTFTTFVKSKTYLVPTFG